MNFLHDKEYIVLLPPTTSSTATSTSVVVDTANCEGVVFQFSVGDLAAACAVSIVTGSSAACEGSTVATISVSTGDHMALFELHKPTLRYAKALVNPGAGAVDGHSVVAIKYGCSKAPVTQGSTSVAGSTILVGSS